MNQKLDRQLYIQLTWKIICLLLILDCRIKNCTSDEDKLNVVCKQYFVSMSFAEEVTCNFCYNFFFNVKLMQTLVNYSEDILLGSYNGKTK